MSLCKLTAAARALSAVDQDLATWLMAAIARLREGTPPGQALELSGPAARRERDKFLTQAAVYLRKSDESLWSLAGTIANRVGQRRFRDTPQQLLNLANEAAPLPKTQRQLYTLLLENLPN